MREENSHLKSSQEAPKAIQKGGNNESLGAKKAPSSRDQSAEGAQGLAFSSDVEMRDAEIVEGEKEKKREKNTTRELRQV